MKALKSIFAAAAFATLAVAIAPSYAAGDDDNANVFVKMCDAAPDGKVSKAEVMKAVEKMFDKHDTRREGKLDRKQAEIFARELSRPSGG
jgi:hypothetical protein